MSQYHKHIGYSSYQLCIDWAVSELVRGVDDEDVCILASSNIDNMDEVLTYFTIENRTSTLPAKKNNMKIHQPFFRLGW